MARILVVLASVTHFAAWGDEAPERTALEDFLGKNISVTYSQSAIFDTHPPTIGDNTGNLFNFVPHGHLVLRQSLVGFQIDLDGRRDEAPGDTFGVVSVELHPLGPVLEDESGEAHHILAKVVDRNYLEPALRKVFRGKLGEAIVHLLDIGVLDRISDRVASELLTRAPVTGTLREFMAEMGRALGQDWSVRVRVGLFQPSMGVPRDETGRSLLDRILITGPDLQYRLGHPGHTLAAEILYQIPLAGTKRLYVTGGIQQPQDPDATLGQTIRNTFFDESATELSLDKVDSFYFRVVLADEGFEAYASAGDNEGPSLAAGVFYRWTGRTAAALEAAYHGRDDDEASPVEKAAETVYEAGVSATLIRDFTDSITGFANAEHLEGSLARREDLTWDKFELGLVYRVRKHTRVGLSTYQRNQSGDRDTGLKLSMEVRF